MMTSEKHSNYNHDTHMPDKRMQANESGLYTWLQEQIIARLGNDQAQAMIAEAAPYKEKRYAWMLEKVAVLGHQDLVEEFQIRKNKLVRDRDMKRKEYEIEALREQLPTSGKERHEYLLKRIAKIEKLLKKQRESGNHGQQ